METNKEKVLEVKDLVISFKTDRGIVQAVRGVNFDLYRGETLCIVGESGSGKSVTNKAVMGISAKNAIVESGSILYEGEDLIRVSEEEFHRIRGHKIGMIFQDPLSALNPVMRIGKQIIEATMINKSILKRRFAELISKELTLYRNNEADYNYNINRLNNDIANNNKMIESFNDTTSTIEKINRDLANEKTQANQPKVDSLNNELKNLNAKLESLNAKFVEYKNSLVKQVEREIKYNQDILDKISKEQFSGDLETTIHNNSVTKYTKIIEYLSSPDFVDLSSNLVESLSKHNEVLKGFQALYKEVFELNEPALKENYKIAKKNAKVEVAKYKAEITAKHQENVKTIEAKIAEVTNQITSLRTSLDISELTKIDEVIKYNADLKKRLEKESKKFRETSISKTVKKDDSPKEIPNLAYAELEKKLDEFIKELEVEKEDFVSKTVITKAQAKKMALQVMKEVGIPMPERRFRQYPFEFSGGMRQRIVIAIALTANPEILICDEPTTALDVTIQAQILELINRLKKERNLSCIFITHDLGVVANMADRVAVMYAGKIVEYGTAEEVFFEPKHPYTWALLSSIPDVDSKEKLEAIPGTPPDMIYPPKGDAFALRSKYAMEIDFKSEPPYFKLSDTHYAATWLLHPDAPKVEMPKIVKERIKNALKDKKGDK